MLTCRNHQAKQQCNSFRLEASRVTDPCSSTSEAVLHAENAAIETWHFAALMLGSESEAMRLVESTFASVEVDPCADPSIARSLVRDRVLQGALAMMHREDPSSFASVPSASPSPCVQDDDGLPLSGAEISDLVSGSGRGRLREWLGHLTQAQRAVFVQRAILGQDNASAASAINRVSRSAIWTPEAVGSLFRQALCSLASSFSHAIPVTQS